MSSDTPSVSEEPPPAAGSDHSGAQQRRQRRRWLIIVTGLALLAQAIAVIAQQSPSGADGRPVLGVTTVEIRNSAFTPPAIQVDQGTTVTWSFADDEAHNVVGEGWGSDRQSDGEFAHTFTAPGTYGYQCTLHTWMDGRVDVIAARAT